MASRNPQLLSLEEGPDISKMCYSISARKSMSLPRPLSHYGHSQPIWTSPHERNMSFALWQDGKQTYRYPTTTEMRYTMEVFHAESNAVHVTSPSLLLTTTSRFIDYYLTTAYHHKSIRFLDVMRSHTQEGLLGPRKYLPGRL